jgi:hypothetical protein
MLLIKTRIERSSIHGLGLYADEAIPTGTVVWRFTPGFDLDADAVLLEALNVEHRQRLLHYGYIDANTGRFILCCDDARFINHSTMPNVSTKHGVDRYGVDVAIRDIAPGEEITMDYSTFEAPAHQR